MGVRLREGKVMGVSEDPHRGSNGEVMGVDDYHWRRNGEVMGVGRTGSQRQEWEGNGSRERRVWRSRQHLMGSNTTPARYYHPNSKANDPVFYTHIYSLSEEKIYEFKNDTIFFFRLTVVYVK